MDKLTRYFLSGGLVIVAGVVLLALATMNLPSPLGGSLGVLGVLGVAVGLVMVVGALWIDLSQLAKERGPARSTNAIPSGVASPMYCKSCGRQFLALPGDAFCPRCGKAIEGQGGG